jgi:Cof subfamily protein (haloacid dehalogenase superfamily)
MNNQYKLLVSDIDGTLVDKNGNISDIDRQALNEIRRAGIMVSLCTGRAARGCLKVLEELSLDGLHIFFDGALVCNSDQTEEIYSRPVRADLMQKVCEFAQSYDLALELFTPTRFFISHESGSAAVHSQLMHYYPVITDLGQVCARENIIMGCIVTNSPEEEEKIKAFRSGFTDTLRFSWTKHPAYPDHLFINVTVAGISKGRALSALMAHLGLSKNQVMAIGDGSNDVSLLSAAGLAVAMQNSPDDLLAVADYIAPDIEQHGVAQTLRKFLA